MSYCLSIILFLILPSISFAEAGDGGCNRNSSLPQCSGVGAACSVENGTGIISVLGSSSYCRITKCSAGYEKVGAACIFKTAWRACRISNGVGAHDNFGGVWSVCRPTSCNRGYVNIMGSCQRPATVSKSKCNVQNGRGFVAVTASKARFCQVTTCNSGFEKNGRVCIRRGAPAIAVRLIVVKNSNGTGNSKWNISYASKMIDQMTEKSVGTIRFTLGPVKDWKSTADYRNPRQDGVKNKFIRFKRFGFVTAVVSQPATTDSAGTALGIKYNFEPLMLIRSRMNDGSPADSSIAGAVLLHELGHNLGMKHSDGNMDTYYRTTPSILRTYAAGLKACTVPDSRCVTRYSKFSTGVVRIPASYTGF